MTKIIITIHHLAAECAQVLLWYVKFNNFDMSFSHLWAKILLLESRRLESVWWKNQAALKG